MLRHLFFNMFLSSRTSRVSREEQESFHAGFRRSMGPMTMVSKIRAESVQYSSYEPEDVIKRLKELAKEQRMDDDSLRLFVIKCIDFAFIHGTDWRKAKSLFGYKALYDRMAAFGFHEVGGGPDAITLPRILNSYPNETVAVLSDLIDRKLHKVVAPISVLNDSLQSLPGAMIIQASGHAETHKKMWDHWFVGYLNRKVVPGQALVIDRVGSDSGNNGLDESLAKAFWSRHVDGKTDVSVKSAYTQATGFPAPTA